MPNEKAAEPLSEEKLAELEEACKDAPPGPWSWRCSDPDYAALVSDAVGGPIVQTTHGVDPHTPVAVLLAESREALPSLLAEVRLGRDLPRGLRFVPDEQGGHLVDDGGLVWRPVARPR